MKRYRTLLFCLLLLFLIAGTAPNSTQRFSNSAASAATAAKKLEWHEKFDGVVHDDTRIAGFVAEYRWLSNFYLSRVQWEGLVYASAEAAYQSGKYPLVDRAVFTTLNPE